MSTRLIILAVVAGTLAAALAFRGSSNSTTEFDDQTPVGKLDDCDLLVRQQKVAGEEPAELPSFEDFTIHVDLDRATVKNRLVFTISESHGYYVDGLDIRFWWQDEGEPIDSDDSVFSFAHHMNNFIKANETFKDCIVISDPELSNVGGDIGVPANWGAEVEGYSHVRVENPEKLPCPTSVEEHCR